VTANLRQEFKCVGFTLFHLFTSKLLITSILNC